MSRPFHAEKVGFSNTDELLERCLFLLLIRIIQVTMLWAKFGRTKIRANLLQRFDNNFGYFNNRFGHKVDKTSSVFSKEITDCCSIPQYLLKFDSKIFQELFIKFFVIVDKVTCKVPARVRIPSEKKFQGFQTEQKLKSPLFF